VFGGSVSRCLAYFCGLRGGYLSYGEAGVREICQYSAVDGASSFAMAGVAAGEKSAEAHGVLGAGRNSRIRGGRLFPARAGGRPEFKGEFGQRYTGRAISRRPLSPRSPDLRAFGDRLQSSVLHLYCRTGLHHRIYTSDD
jgi:hypothetical protein